MHSFLVLPMQRITRLPLLVDVSILISSVNVCLAVLHISIIHFGFQAICHRCEPGSDEFVKTDAALKAVNKVT